MAKKQKDAENAYIRQFLEKLASRKYTAKSINTFRYPLRLFFSFLASTYPSDSDGAARQTAGQGGGCAAIQLNEITVETLEAYRSYLVKKNMQPQSLGLYIRTLRKFFKHLEEEGLIFENVAKYLEVPKVERRLPQVPTEEDMTRLISAINITKPVGVRDRAMIETLYSCALRLNELVFLTVFNVDLDNNMLRVIGKGRKERVLPLTGQAASWLNNYLASARPKLLGDRVDQNCLWLSCKGLKMTSQVIQKNLQSLAKKAQLKDKITVHSIRRACATHMLQNGAHPAQVQLLLGHASITTLRNYLKLTIKDIRKTHKQSKVGK